MLRRKVPRIVGLDLKAAEATQSHPEAKAECRMQNAERRKARQSHPEPHQSHINATSKPPQSLLIANRLRSQDHSKATLKPPQSHPKATPKPPQSHPKATRKPTNQAVSRPGWRENHLSSQGLGPNEN